MFKKANVNFEYEILDTYEAGLVLTKYQVRMMRKQPETCDITTSYCNFTGHELYLHNVKVGSLISNMKCLLNKYELKKIKRKVQEGGLTVVPSIVFFNDNGLVKTKIHICRGKKLYDKRQAIKTRDIKRKLKQI